MLQGARTPEELETLFEDAFLLRDQQALMDLFEAGAVLMVDGGSPEARGSVEISRLAGEMWRRDEAYLARSGRILQAGDTALVLAGDHGVSVLRRGDDGSWRYAISCLPSHARSP